MTDWLLAARDVATWALCVWLLAWVIECWICDVRETRERRRTRHG